MFISKNLFRYSVFVDTVIKKNIKEKSFSYYKFCLENKKGKKKERIKAIKKFLDYTRN